VIIVIVIVLIVTSQVDTITYSVSTWLVIIKTITITIITYLEEWVNAYLQCVYLTCDYQDYYNNNDHLPRGIIVIVIVLIVTSQVDTL
jgi:hypothetical protein